MPPNLINVEQVYTKDEKLKRDDVKAILQWSKTQPHLPEITESQVILFLHSCYYDSKAAKQTIDSYFTCRTHYSEYFNYKLVTKDAIERFFSVHFVNVLPRRTPGDDVVVAIKFLQSNPKLFSCLEFIRIAVMILTSYIHQNEPAKGLVLLFDMDGITFGYLLRMNVLAVKRMIGFLQESAPVRIKALHYVNVVPVTGKILSILKPFMKKETAEAIHLHLTSMESLYEHVPKKCLPEDYGGELPPIKTLVEKCAPSILDHWEFFKWHDTQKVEESKRPR